MKPLSETEKGAEESKPTGQPDAYTMEQIGVRSNLKKQMVITNQAHIRKKSKIDIEKSWGESGCSLS